MSIELSKMTPDDIPMKPRNIRMDDETFSMGAAQGALFGLNLSQYIRMIIHLEPATEIIKRLKNNNIENQKEG